MTDDWTFWTIVAGLVLAGGLPFALLVWLTRAEVGL